METFIGLVLLGGIGYAIYRMTKKKETVQETVVDKAGEEIKANIDAKTEEAFVKAMEKSAKIIDVPKESAELLDKVQDAIMAEAKEAASELAKTVEPAVKKTRKVRTKAKAIEAVVEAKVEKLETAVKKTRTKKAK
jgi:hypothetical protein